MIQFNYTLLVWKLSFFLFSASFKRERESETKDRQRKNWEKETKGCNFDEEWSDACSAFRATFFREW